MIFICSFKLVQLHVSIYINTQNLQTLHDSIDRLCLRKNDKRFVFPYSKERKNAARHILTTSIEYMSLF